MRAFLSFKHADDRAMRSRFFPATAKARALDEAQKVMAEAEPWRRGGADYERFPQVWWLLPRHRSQDTGPERMAREAMAQAIEEAFS